MNKISEYLINNPEYYIDWWESILTNISDVKNNIDNVLFNFRSITFTNSLNQCWEASIFDINNNYKIGRIIYMIDKLSWFWCIARAWLDGNYNKWVWFWKILYIKTAVEAMKNGNILVSDSRRSLSFDAKYLWNSLVNLWLVEYDEDMKRFKFINNMLEDYFIDDEDLDK